MSSSIPVENPELILDVKDLHYSEHGVTKVDKVNFSIRGGEILGVAGVQGNGQEQLIKAITGLIPFQDGTVKLAGTEIQGMNIAQKRDGRHVLHPGGSHDRWKCSGCKHPGQPDFDLL